MRFSFPRKEKWGKKSNCGCCLQFRVQSVGPQSNTTIYHLSHAQALRFYPINLSRVL